MQNVGEGSEERYKRPNFYEHKLKKAHSRQKSTKMSEAKAFFTSRSRFSFIVKKVSVCLIDSRTEA